MSRKIAFRFAGISLIAVSIAGCGVPAEVGLEQMSKSEPHLAQPPGERDDTGKLIYLAAQTMMERAEGLARDKPIVVATIVSVDDLQESSMFGRLASQLVANRIEQRGYLVRDMTYMRALEFNSEGEFALSRDARKVSQLQDAQAVVTGTYAVAGDEIYLTLRLLRAENGELLSSADASIPLNDNSSSLLQQEDTFASSGGTGTGGHWLGNRAAGIMGDWPGKWDAPTGNPSLDALPGPERVMATHNCSPACHAIGPTEFSSDGKQN